jgi:hypothetical protein
MPENLPYHDDAIFNPETAHEKSDVNVRALLLAVALFIVIGFITHFVVLGLFRFFVKLEQGDPQAALTGMARPADAGVPREPRLQPFPRTDTAGVAVMPNRNTPVTDMVDMRAAEDRVLKSYGWIDAQKGVVHIPIDEAKRLVVQRGMPVNTRATLPPATTTGEAPQ